MSITLNDTMDTAKATMEHAKDETQHAVSTARGVLFDGIRTLASVVSMVRSFELDDVLGWVNLSRRRNLSGSLALFGAGVIVGTSVGFLFAPVSGAEARRTILDKLKGLEGDAKRTAHDIEGKAEALADKAKSTVVNAEHKLEDMAGQAKDSLMSAEKNRENRRPAPVHVG